MFPKGYGEPNPKAVEFYQNVIEELINHGIEPFINLYHFDMPFELQKIGGWKNRFVVERYVQYSVDLNNDYRRSIKKEDIGSVN
jgi:6-phospho-beta-glucosidase